MTKQKNIEKLFETNVSKASFEELCKEENTGNSMISSKKLSFKYDNISQDIKTSDTIFFSDDKIEFIEFKDVNSSKLSGKNKREFIRQLRLKAIESYISLYNFLNDNSYPISKDEVSNLALHYYFIFNKEQFKTKPLLLNTFSAAQIRWTKQYSRFFNKISFLDHETFVKKFKI